MLAKEWVYRKGSNTENCHMLTNLWEKVEATCNEWLLINKENQEDVVSWKSISSKKSWFSVTNVVAKSSMVSPEKYTKWIGLSDIIMGNVPSTYTLNGRYEMKRRRLWGTLEYLFKDKRSDWKWCMRENEWFKDIQAFGWGTWVNREPLYNVRYRSVKRVLIHGYIDFYMLKSYLFEMEWWVVEHIVFSRKVWVGESE